MLKALTDFSCHITDEAGLQHLLEFREGDIIWDAKIAGHLVALGCPVVALTDATTVVCSRCRKVFDSQQHPCDAFISLVNCTTQIEGHTLTYRAGEIVEHSWIRDALTSAGVPVEAVHATACPSCSHVFRP